jgi:hypothetical protein
VKCPRVVLGEEGMLVFPFDWNIKKIVPGFKNNKKTADFPSNISLINYQSNIDIIPMDT